MRRFICLAALVTASLPALADVDVTFTQGSTVLNFSLPTTILNYGYPYVTDEVPYYYADLSSINGQPTDTSSFVFHGGYERQYIEQEGYVTLYEPTYFDLFTPFPFDTGYSYVGDFPGFVTRDANGDSESLTFVPGTYSFKDGFYGKPVTFATLAITQTPEPSTFALLGTGLLGALGVVRRRVLTTR